ncbi:alpha/beta hydrolase [Pseudonocardia sp. NPDC049154]|uniref:alpha/beta hydrolase n=1 Tax=Pseudonocardia sp. NPDC049154 TaxID=3155501 RepID=UPI0033C49995
MSPYPVDEDLVASVAALPHVDRTDVAAARRIAASRVPPRPAAEAGVTVEDHTCTGADGYAVPLRVYRPDRPRGPGAVLHVHGGGFILGDLDAAHPRNVEIAREVGVVVVSVGYRLAPEWPFPTPVEDVHSGLVWLHEHAGELGVDPALVVVHGVSAGGALATATALWARDRGGPPVRFLFLASPVLDDRLATASSRRFTDTPALTRRDVEVCWSAYLGPVERGTAEVPVLAAPGRSADLAGLPPTYVSVAEFDPLRDEAIDFARSLLAAAVGVELHLFPGTYHGSLGVRGAAVSERQLVEEIAVLRRVVRGVGSGA